MGTVLAVAALGLIVPLAALYAFVRLVAWFFELGRRDMR